MALIAILTNDKDLINDSLLPPDHASLFAFEEVAVGFIIVLLGDEAEVEVFATRFFDDEVNYLFCPLELTIGLLFKGGVIDGVIEKAT